MHALLIASGPPYWNFFYQDATYCGNAAPVSRMSSHAIRKVHYFADLTSGLTMKISPPIPFLGSIAVAGHAPDFVLDTEEKQARSAKTSEPDYPKWNNGPGFKFRRLTPVETRLRKALRKELKDQPAQHDGASPADREHRTGFGGPRVAMSRSEDAVHRVPAGAPSTTVTRDTPQFAHDDEIPVVRI